MLGLVSSLLSGIEDMSEVNSPPLFEEVLLLELEEISPPSARK